MDIRDDAAPNSRHGLKCAPRSLAAAHVELGGCPAGPSECTSKPAEELVEGEGVAPANVTDYTNFCYVSCRPEGAHLNDLCVEADNEEAGSITEQAANDPSARKARAAAAMSLMHSPVARAMTQFTARRQPAAAADMSGALLPLAKGQMIEAMIHAKAAGQAAMLAKESYEQVLRSARVSATEAGKATIAEIRRESAEQAKEAVLIRERYEAAAKASAIKAALKIAQVYKDAMGKAQGVASMWSDRSMEYATAAAQRKKMAQDIAKKAFKYYSTQDFKMARDENMQAHQAMDQAADFAKRSTAAFKEAQVINGHLKWYVYAESAAAANMLAKAMPPDVAPPDMPPLP